jgi:hypothetical protein
MQQAAAASRLPGQRFPARRHAKETRFSSSYVDKKGKYLVAASSLTKKMHTDLWEATEAFIKQAESGMARARETQPEPEAEPEPEPEPSD